MNAITPMSTRRHGSVFLAAGQVRFSLWRPSADQVLLEIEDRQFPLARDRDGWYSLETAALPGERYAYIIDGKRTPDPASRSQPDGVTGRSELVDPQTYRRAPDAWRGRPWTETNIYEMHIGAFSPTGDFAGAEKRLDHLRDMHYTAIEIMPLNALEGSRDWGYDGIFPSALQSTYGRPEDLRRFIDAAHARGLQVFLDVVYNHLGDGADAVYDRQYFTSAHQTPWGNAIDFTKPPVRDFFIQNAHDWIEQYGFDGLRFDAVHEIHDDSPKHFLQELAETVRADIPRERSVHLMLENAKNQAGWLKRDDDGTFPFYNAQWNDDSLNSENVAATGQTYGYYGDYARGTFMLMGRALTKGFGYQGEISPKTGEPRGEDSTYLPPDSFIAARNHDYDGNRPHGERLWHLNPRSFKISQSVSKLAPHIPLDFMGDEWAASTPFLYFRDLHGKLADTVRKGRRKEFKDHPDNAKDGGDIPDPNDPQTFYRSRLKWDETKNGFYAAAMEHTRRLNILREQIIVPLISSRFEHASADEIENQGVRCQWVYTGKEFTGERILQMAPNFSDSWMRLEKPLEGRMIWEDTPAMPLSEARHEGLRPEECELPDGLLRSSSSLILPWSCRVHLING